jgi:hypothetical protein
MENLDLEESLGSSTPVSDEKVGNTSEKDFITGCGNIFGSSEDMWRSGLKLHSDEQAKICSDASQYTNNRHQMYLIINDTSEEVNNENNPVINPHNLKRGANHIADGEARSTVADREKVYLSAGEWWMIKEAVNHGVSIMEYSKREVLMRYQYALHQQKKQLLRERSEIWRRHESANTTIRILQEECSNASHTGGGRRREPNRGEAEWQHKDDYNSSILSVNEIGNIMPKTPKAALVVAQAYLVTTQVAPGDPREGMHQAAIKGLGLIGDKLQ